MIDMPSFIQGVIVGLFLGIVLSEVVLPRLVDIWVRLFRRGRGE